MSLVCYRDVRTRIYEDNDRRVDDKDLNLNSPLYMVSEDV